MKTNIENQNSQLEAEIAVLTATFNNDLKTSVLVVSILTNLFVLTAWLVLQSTHAYDAQLIGFLFNR